LSDRLVTYLAAVLTAMFLAGCVLIVLSSREKISATQTLEW
jgi:hypothetical protein